MSLWLLILFVTVLLGLVLALWYIVKLRHRICETSKSERMKLAFLHNINNEIHIPLKSVADLANTIAKDNLYLSKNEKRNIADQLVYHSNLISTLVDEIIMFSDNSKEGRQLHIESFSPNALCRRCLEGNALSIYHRQAVKLNFKRELNDEFFVKNDRHLIELILNKLILNACRFTEVGEVVVGCNLSENTGSLTIFVEDTGVGVPENRRNNLFSWFESPDDIQDDVEIDLSICRRVAQKIGGELIMDENYQRRGTRFVLIVPLR